MNLEVKSNPIAQLKLLKQFTFTDKLVFLDELIQNASRAKAKSVIIEADSQSVTIKNDGVILDDPQSLFSIAESNWDNSVNEESPFGIGFFSVVAAFNNIEVISGTNRINMDVERLLANDTTGLVHTESDYVEGFEVRLTHPITELSTYKMEDRVKDIGLYSDNLDLVFNGEEIKKLDKFEIPSSFDITEVVNDDKLKGYVALKQYGWDNGVSIYYKGRKVTDLSTPFITGNLHVESGFITLRAPDRKDIIRDDSYTALMNRITELRESLALKAVNSGAMKRAKYAQPISEYLDVNDYYDRIELKVIQGEELHLMDEYFSNNPESNFKDFLFEKSKVETKTEDTTVVESISIAHNINSEDRVYTSSSSTSYSSGPTMDLPKDTYDYSGLRTFYVKYDELSRYRTKIGLMKKYGLSIVIAMDELELKVCEYYGMVHLSVDLNLDIKYISKVHVEPKFSSSDLRAVQILNSVSKHLTDRELFKIAKVHTTECVELHDLGYKVEKDLGEKPMVLSECKSFIYINPTILDTRLSGKSDKFTLNDYKFILRYLDDIIHVIQKIVPGKHRENLMNLLSN